jgi:hypothetical protein
MRYCRHHGLIAQNVAAQRLAANLTSARRNRVTPYGLIALMPLLSAYSGQPRTSLAMERAMACERAAYFLDSAMTIVSTRAQKYLFAIIQESP